MYTIITDRYGSVELENCPFCGGEPDLEIIGNDLSHSKKVKIYCTKCFTAQTTATIKLNFKWCKDVALKKWNLREGERIKKPNIYVDRS